MKRVKRVKLGKRGKVYSNRRQDNKHTTHMQMHTIQTHLEGVTRKDHALGKFNLMSKLIDRHTNIDKGQPHNCTYFIKHAVAARQRYLPK